MLENNKLNNIYVCCLGTTMFALDIRHINESRALQTRMRHKFAVG